LDRTIRALSLVLAIAAASIQAQSVPFDFDNLPPGSGLPGNYVQGNVTASFTSTGLGGYYIQQVDTYIVKPAGFAGNMICPSSTSSADLLVSFSAPLSDFSIMYSPEEYGCGDSSATMRVTGYLGANFVATNTATAPIPGTWPTGTLSLSAPQGFDNVVVHYDTPPPGCSDIGWIFMADNMFVTPLDKIFANGFE
jgi:hypothetical protein